MEKRLILFMILLISFSFYYVPSYVSGQTSNPLGNTVCCEKTNTGALCQNVLAGECASDSRQVPTSCESTSFCKVGTCYDSSEGTCLDNTPELVCNQEGGVWSEEAPPQCELGCCVLGDQAAFVSLVRCKKLSATLGLETNYDTSIRSELQCVQQVQQQEKGACVYEFEFEKTCKFTTRSECESSTETSSESVSGGNFYAGKLCSAEELGTNCGPTTKTECVLGKDAVYFIDSCGNPANIYDSSKVNDAEYWTNVKDKSESCGFGSSNAGNPNCGTCDYLQGSICRSESAAGVTVTGKPVYGDFICADLNCIDDQGEKRTHGESWCAYEDYGITDSGGSSVGSRAFKNICVNGEVVLEQCADFRAEVCVQGEINGFSQAACRVNRWQDCVAQIDQQSCENLDKRDCRWEEGISLQLANTSNSGSCLPNYAPGLNFWDDLETQDICSQGNAVCYVQFEKGLFGGEECVDNCDCLTDDWEKQRADVCTALGDCGPAYNWIGQKGYDKGYKVTSEIVEAEE